MRSGAMTLVAALVAVGLAGCFGDADAPAAAQDDQADRGAEWSEAALAYGEGHDHADPDHHRNLSTPNFETVGHNALVSPEYGTTAWGSLCGDAQETTQGRRLAAIETRSDVAFTLADVTDPLDPQFLGELVMRRTYVYDLAVVPDGKHVVLTTSQPKDPDQGSVDDGTPWATWRSPCAPGGPVPVEAPVAEDPVPRPLSIVLVDISDPSRPTVVDQRPLLGIGHSVYSTIVDGQALVLASTYATNNGLSNYQLYRLTGAGGTTVMEHLSTYTIGTAEPDTFLHNVGHNDAWIAHHPKTGQLLGWLAHWDYGLVILDLSDLRNPQPLARWTDYDPAAPVGDTGGMHSVHVVSELWDGRHYVVVGPELAAHPPSTPSGLVWVLDTTDPTDPAAVGVWTLPHEVQWDGRLQFSTHYLTVVGRHALVSMYHAGVWALDASVVGAAGDPVVNLPSVGVYMPVPGSTEAWPKTPMRWSPTLEEVHSFRDGTLVTFDSNSGVYAFTYDTDAPADTPRPWDVAHRTWSTIQPLPMSNPSG